MFVDAMNPAFIRFASSDPQPVIVRHRPKCSRATTANADRLIAGCLITSAAPLRFLLSISKYLPYLTRPRDCAREPIRHPSQFGVLKLVTTSKSSGSGGRERTSRERVKFFNDFDERPISPASFHFVPGVLGRIHQDCSCCFFWRWSLIASCRLRVASSWL